MSDLIKLDTMSNVKMSSKEISEMTGKRHAHVCRDIRTQLQEQEINETIFGSVYLDKKKEKRLLFELDYEQTMILISGYSIPLRAKIIKRWTELENKSKPEPPTQLQLAEQVVELLKEQQVNAPKVALADECIRDTIKQLSITDAGKQLGLSQTKIFSILREKKLLTQKKIPTQNALDRKLLSVRINVVAGKNRPQTVMTMENIFNFKRIYGKEFK